MFGKIKPHTNWHFSERCFTIIVRAPLSPCASYPWSGQTLSLTWRHWIRCQHTLSVMKLPLPGASNNVLELGHVTPVDGMIGSCGSLNACTRIWVANWFWRIRSHNTWCLNVFWPSLAWSVLCFEIWVKRLQKQSVLLDTSTQISVIVKCFLVSLNTPSLIPWCIGHVPHGGFAIDCKQPTYEADSHAWKNPMVCTMNYFVTWIHVSKTTSLSMLPTMAIWAQSFSLHFWAVPDWSLPWSFIIASWLRISRAWCNSWETFGRKAICAMWCSRA